MKLYLPKKKIFQVLIKILQITDFQVVNIILIVIFLSTKYIHQLQAYMYNIINIYLINYITVNFRKKLWSCQAITHFLADYQTAILIKNTTKHHSRFLLIVL